MNWIFLAIPYLFVGVAVMAKHGGNKATPTVKWIAPNYFTAAMIIAGWPVMIVLAILITTAKHLMEKPQ
jgi:hypothetical protein